MADRKYYRGGVWNTQNGEQVFDGSTFQLGQIKYYDGSGFIPIGQAVQTVDNLEDSPNGPYATGDDLATYYTGDTGLYQRRTTGTAEGSFNVELTDPSGFPKIISTPGDGLPAYPAKGDVFASLVQANEVSGSIGGGAVLFGVSDIDNFYRADVRPAVGDIRIAKIDGGSFTALNSTPASLSAETWYDAEVEWHDGSGGETDDTIVLNVYEASDTDGSRGNFIDSVSVTDSTFATAVGMGFQSTTDNEVSFFDNYRITGSV